jgi:SAM-dependent methyltransferase
VRLVHVRCIVCAAERHELIVSAREVRAQLRYLRAFHRRRRWPGDDPRARDELAARADLTHEYATDIVACSGCGLVFRNPRPVAEQLERAYARDCYPPERLAALFDVHLALYRPRARRLTRWLSSERRVRAVEIGSFVGGFLAAAQGLGWDIVGVDPGAQVAEFCRRRGLRVIAGTLDELHLDGETLDCVAIWNTFDQLPDPESVIARARRLLRRGGLFAVRIPNGASFRRLTLAARRRAPFAPWVRALMAWNNLLAFPYLHGHSAETLDRLLRRHRLERIALHPDTLSALSDGRTKAWAAIEERALKLLARLGSRLSTRIEAPWLDAYYRAA